MRDQQNAPSSSDLQRELGFRAAPWTRESRRLKAGSAATEGRTGAQFEHLVGGIHQIADG